MERACPNAYYLHYANPTNTVSLGLSLASPIKSVGLCHSVEGTAKELASGYLGKPFSEVSYWAAGGYKNYCQVEASNRLEVIS